MRAGIVNGLATRKCRGCDDHKFHTHHLTWFGRHYYVNGLRKKQHKARLKLNSIVNKLGRS